MAHIDRTSMWDIHGVHAIRFQARARAPDLVLPPRETPRRYMRQNTLYVLSSPSVTLVIGEAWGLLLNSLLSYSLV